MDHQRRIGQLRRRMNRAGLPALLITHLTDVRYLCGFTGSNAALAITRRAARLFTDGRYTTQAGQEVSVAKIEIASGPVALAAVQWIAAQPGVVLAGFDPAKTSVADLSRLRATLPARLRSRFLIETAAPLVEKLRMTKGADEIEIICEAALIGCRVFDHMLGFLRPGLAEFEVAAELEHQARLLGAEGMSFETIVASGPRSGALRGRATAARLPRKGFLTLDFGIIREGYCSDMTRTVYLGQPSDEERRVYQAVLEAELAGIAAVAPGVRCSEIDEASRSILRAAGLAQAFTHSTGHGVGLEIHEPPRVGAQQPTRLLAGMVVTIEPGVYLEGRYGIRIEDMVAVTSTGAQVLTPAPKALIEL